MLTRTDVALASMADGEFLQRLKNTPLGRELLTAREETVARKRQAAAEAVSNAYAAEAAALQCIDKDIAAAQRKIEALATDLQRAQEHHGSLSQERNAAINVRLQIVRKSLGYLQGTAPRELLELASLVRLANHSAKFQMKQRTQTPRPIGNVDPAMFAAEARKAEEQTLANWRKAKALGVRARAVDTQVQQMLLSPNPDLALVAKLKAYLDVPAELTRTRTDSRKLEP